MIVDFIEGFTIFIGFILLLCGIIFIYFIVPFQIIIYFEMTDLFAMIFFIIFDSIMFGITNMILEDY